MTDVRPKESVKFSWQTISLRGFVTVKILERIRATTPSQDVFSSSLSADTFSGLEMTTF